ncbi:MAG: glycosyltransferase family 4 protein [Caldilineaceae bacterium]|nr:glycosyltransferase family 4 protein [Caldilineaceae bacterium]
MPRILYFCPDFPQPSGGIKTLYRHVCRLRDCGFDATIIHQRSGFRAAWHGYDAPVIWLEDRPTLDANDLWVLPEVMVDLARQTRSLPGQRVVIALSWAPAYNHLQPGERWQDLGIHQVLTKSPVIKEYLEWAMEIEVSLIPEFIDPALYHRDEAAKGDKVSFITRKDAAGPLLAATLQRKGAPFSDYEWMALRELNEVDYARHLRDSALFLTTTVQEGMHVSVLEAMASGCLVIGFSGIGGGVYMVGEGDGQNCILVENGNLPMLGEKLEAVIRELADQPDRYAHVIENAVKLGAGYPRPTKRI